MSLALIGALAFNVHAATTLPEDFTVEGRLYDAGGLPLNTAVDLKLEIVDENAPTCVLYRELRTNVDVSSADASARGVFSVRLGAAPAYPTTGLSFTGIFAPVALTGEGGCVAPAVAGSHRLVRTTVKFHGASDGTYETLTPDTRVTAVPLAKIAENALSLQGVGTSSLLVLNGSTSLQQPNFEYLFSTPNYDKLKSLVDGASPQYVRATPTAPVDWNNQQLKNVARPTAATDAATKGYADETVAGKAVDVSAIGPTLGNDSILRWDSVNNKWVAGPQNTTPGGPAGGDLVGTYPNPTVGSGKIDSSKLAVGAVATRHITTASPAVNRLLLTDAVTGANIVQGDCATNEVYAWTATGWACANVQSLSPVTSVAGRTGAIALNAGDISGLGTAALKDYGTTSNTVPILDGSARLPAVDASLLTNVNATKLAGRPVGLNSPLAGQVLIWNSSQWEPGTLTTGSVTRIDSGPGLLGGPISTSGTLAVDVGTAAGKIVQLNAGAQLPAIDGSLLTGVSAAKLASRNLASTAPAAGQTLLWNATAAQWEPGAAAGGTVTRIVAGAGLLGGPITASGTLVVDVGTTAGKVVQMNASAQLPAVDGSLLVSVNATRLATKPVSSTTPMAGQYLYWNSTLNQWEPNTPNNGTLTRIDAGTGLLGGTITASGSIAVDVGTTAGQILQLGPGGTLPAVDGSLLTNVNATLLASRAVSSTAPTTNQFLGWNTTTSTWTPSTLPAQTFVAGTGIVGGTIASAGTISVDVGTGSAKIPQLNLSAQLALANGTALAPTYSFANATGTGMLGSASSVLALATGGTARLLITPTGNVGIGTTNPGYLLTVNGTASAAALCMGTDCRSSWTAGLVNNIAGSPDIGVSSAAGTTTLSLLTTGTGANQILRLDANAKIPAVNGSLITNLDASKITAGTLDVSRMPAVSGDVSANAGSFYTTVSGLAGKTLTVTSLANGNFIRYDGGKWVNANLTVNDLPSTVIQGSGAAGYFPVFVDGTSVTTGKLFQNSTGVGVGTTTISSGTALEVNGNITTKGFNQTQGYLQVTSNTQNSVPASTSNGGLALGWNYYQGFAEVDFWNTYIDSGNAPAAKSFAFNAKTGPGTGSGDWTNIMTLYPPTNYYAMVLPGRISALSVNQTSDGRLKRDISTLNGSLDKILSLRGVSYHWIDSTRGLGEEVGFIAQELELIFPQLVVTDSDGMKAVDYSHLISPVIEAIKTLYEKFTATNAKVDVLRDEVETDRNRIQKLEAENALLKARLDDLEQRLQSR